MKDGNRPLMVSIRCITYNHEPYIRQCLEGFVMQQTNFRFEAIVHDDASTDCTALIIKEYAEKYPDIIKPIFEAENQWSKHDGTLQRIMNEACQGKYTAMCEGDDFWIDPLKLQKQVNFLEENPNCSLVCNRTKRYSESKKRFISDNCCYERPQYVSPDDIIVKGGLFISACSVVYRTSVKSNYPSYCINCHVGDYPLVIMSVMKGDVFYMNDCMSVYRVENDTSWVGRNREKKLSTSKLLGIISEIRMLQGFQNQYPQYNNAFQKRINNYILSNIPNSINDPEGYNIFTKALNKEISSIKGSMVFYLWWKSSRFFKTYNLFMKLKSVLNNMICL